MSAKVLDFGSVAIKARRGDALAMRVLAEAFEASIKEDLVDVRFMEFGAIDGKVCLWFVDADTAEEWLAEQNEAAE